MLLPRLAEPGELDRYLEQVASLKATLDIPIVASLNGITASGWMTHAKEIADAGADALELNAYYVAGGEQGPTDPPVAASAPANRNRAVSARKLGLKRADRARMRIDPVIPSVCGGRRDGGREEGERGDQRAPPRSIASRAHSASAVCTPSRYALLTGRGLEPRSRGDGWLATLYRQTVRGEWL